jgi:O-antigen ligase
LSYLQWSIVAICTAFPIVIFVVPRGANTSFYLLLVISLFGVASRYVPIGKGFGKILREYWPVNLAMVGLVCAIFANQLSLGHFVLKTYDMSSRLACFALLFWIMLLMPGKGMKHIQWGLIIGAMVCAAALYIQTGGGADRPQRLFGIPTIPFGNIALLMGILALLSIGWNEPGEKTSIVLKLAAGGSAVYGSYLSQTRGAWLALPVFMAIAFALLRNLRARHKFTFFVAAIVLLGSSYVLSSAIQKRIDEGASDISHYLDKKDLNTSLGTRLQLWRGSWLLLKERPVFGIGMEQFPRSLRQLAARHEITAEAAAQPHSHNELLFHMTTLGMPGLLAILSLYFVPAFYFFRELNHPDRETRTVAGMGLALALGFFIFGLTDVMFYWTVIHTFYVVVLAVLFAHLVKRKELLSSVDQ